MELRSSNHFHYINAIKGGKVTRVPNVYRGKPALKFKNLVDVYGDLTNAPNSPARRRPKAKLDELPEKPPLDGREVKVENLQMFEGSEPEIERESGASSNGNSRKAAEEDNDDDDLDFCCITLEQIRGRCISKKRKRSGEASPTGSCLLGAEEDDCDMMESLSSLRAKKKKIRKNQKRINDLCPSIPVLAIAKFEDVPSGNEFPCHSDSSSPYVLVKDEVPESDHGDCQATVLSDWVEPLASFGLSSDDEEPGLSSEFECEIPETEHPDGQAIAVVNLLDSSNGWVEPLASFGLASDEGAGLSFGCEVEMGMPIVCPLEVVELENHGSQTEESETARTSNDIGNEFQCCSVETDSQSEEFENGQQTCPVNKKSYEHLECLESSPPSSRCASSEESDTDEEPDLAAVSIDEVKDLGVGAIVKDEEEAKRAVQQLDVSLPQVEIGDMVVDSNPSGKLDKLVSPSNDPCSIVEDGSQDELQNTSKAASKIETTTKDSNVCVVVDSYRIEGEAKNESPLLETTVYSCTNAVSGDQVQISHPCSSQDVCSSSLTADVEMRFPLSPSCDMERSSSDQPVKLVPGEDSDASDQRPHPPERLLSSRKAISPTSQEKLRKAMESNELDDKQFYKFARKLCYEKQQPERTNARPDGVNQGKRAAENTVSPQQFMRKLKNPKSISPPPNDVPKVISRPVRAPTFSTGCTSIQSCSENAISFSQNQMRDFESMAAKLTKELKSMKEIAEATLHVNPSASPKYTHQEASSAIEKATRVEENARRWLSTMTRDCDRFCKLMKLAQKGPSTPAANVVVQKEKRKISFADEAGGKLCHVKTFKSEVEFMEPVNVEEAPSYIVD